MAKSRRSKAIPLRTPMDPEKAARIRRFLAHVGGVVVFVAVMALLLISDRRYVEQKLVIAKQPPKVVLKNRPVWMSDFLADQIARTARPAVAHSAFDHQLLVDTVAMLRANPWIREVKQVRRAFANQPGDTLEVDCEYRAPVALVHWKDYYWLVDGDGVKLPEAFGQEHLPRIMFGQNKQVNIRVIDGVRQAPPQSGAKWVGDDLRAGLELVKLLYGRQYAEEIDKVDVSNFALRVNSRGPQLVLGTRYGTQVWWGQPINSADFFVELSPAQKLACMESIVREYGRVDNKCRWVDIRFDTVTYPPSEKAQTAATEIAR